MEVHLQQNSSHHFYQFFPLLVEKMKLLYSPRIWEKLSNVTLEFEDTSAWNLRCRREEGTIYVPAGLLAYLWHSCYLNYHMYQRFSEGLQHQESFFDITPEMEVCNKRLSDIIRGFPLKDEKLLPLPQPGYDVNDGSISSTASEIMLYAVAAVLLHELYHILVYREGKQYGGAKEENEADAFASREFICQEVLNLVEKSERNAFKLKCFWALTELCSFPIRVDCVYGLDRTHGNSFDRFENVFAQHTGIFQLTDDRDYKGDSGLDMRPIVSYATSVIHMGFIFDIRDNPIEYERYKKHVSERIYESTLDCFHVVEAYVKNYINSHVSSEG